ncbi:hypothetical protein ACM64Y_15140 [Novispirillum sp. DQ9]|uniref:hypothetical protein n=1 Tax=Novispirillum sp. DQ9 TaxID=3398612 RepID=UPI003C7ACFA8
MKRIFCAPLALLMLGLWQAPAQARCIANQSPATLEATVSLIFVKVGGGRVEPWETRCFPFGFLAHTHVYSVRDPSRPGDLYGAGWFSFTTDGTRITVTPKPSPYPNTAPHELDFCRDC